MSYFENEQWSGDLNFIQNIDICIKAYGEALFNDDMEQMFNVIQFLEIITSPEIDNDKVENNLEWLEDNLDGWNVRDSENKVIAHNYHNKKLIKKTLRDTLRLLLLKLEKEGIYTKNKKDPSKAMGQFRSA